MAIPDYETIMLPLLRIIGDKKERPIKELYEQLADHFKLSEEEKTELYPTGNGIIFQHRVRFAKLYLLKAGLLISPNRGTVQITSRGEGVLKEGNNKITEKFLRKYPEFLEFKAPSEKRKKKIPESKKDKSKTPKEIIEYAYQNYRDELSNELLSIIKDSSPMFFENLVVDLIVAMGYGGSRKDAGKAVGKSQDGGIDGIIKEDKLGLDTIYIQAKRWNKAPIGRPELQKFVGALQEKHSKRGIFITNSSFTKEALDYVSKIDIKVITIDGNDLAEYMIDYDVGLTPIATYRIKQLDGDYFNED
ncbi:MAG: restriction endonuclease [Candidatus Kariarchaeaceae archaeon]|jgi:restriction system protein